MLCFYRKMAPPGVTPGSRHQAMQRSLFGHVPLHLHDNVLVELVRQIAFFAIFSSTCPPSPEDAAQVINWLRLLPTKMLLQRCAEHPSDGHAPLLASPAEHCYVHRGHATSKRTNLLQGQPPHGLKHLFVLDQPLGHCTGIPHVPLGLISGRGSEAACVDDNIWHAPEIFQLVSSSKAVGRTKKNMYVALLLWVTARPCESARRTRAAARHTDPVRPSRVRLSL